MSRAPARSAVALAVVAAVVATGAAGACGNFRATSPAPIVARPALDPIVRKPDTQTIRVYWIGHATVLIRMEDKWILTDPMFSSRLAVFEKRRVAPGIDLSALPAIDWILISHAHPDHLDFPSLALLDPDATLALPPGVWRYMPRWLRFERVAALHWWRSVARDGVRVTAVPASHSNGRYFIDSLWNRCANTGWIVEYGALTLFFAGDTGYHPTMFKQIRERYQVDVALIPVGPANRPRWLHELRKRVHATPEDAMRIFEDVGAKWMVPIHYGTFFKGGPAELRAIVRGIESHPLRDRVVMLPIGGSASFEVGAGAAAQPAGGAGGEDSRRRSP